MKKTQDENGIATLYNLIIHTLHINVNLFINRKNPSFGNQYSLTC